VILDILKIYDRFPADKSEVQVSLIMIDGSTSCESSSNLDADSFTHGDVRLQPDVLKAAGYNCWGIAP